MPQAALIALEQIWSVGVLFIGLHCSGMCGPLIVGLDVGQVRGGASSFQAIKNALLYQSGRALTYGSFGLLAGFLGERLQVALNSFGAVFALLMGIALLISLFSPHQWWQLKFSGAGLTPLKKKQSRLFAYIAPLQRWAFLSARHRGGLETVLLGIMMGFLPCMITLWALGLAISTGSAAYGALVMLSLIVLTTPVIGLSALSVKLLPKSLIQNGRWLQEGLLFVSAVWLILMAMASLELIPHAHLYFTLFRSEYMIMFW